MKKFDRVILKEDFCKNNKTILENGTIGTIREFIDTNVLIQVDYIEDKPKHVGVPEEYLRLVTSEDLDSIQNINDCKKIINKLYHPNNNYVTKEGIVYTIKGIRLGSNELYDEFIVSVQNGTYIESKNITRKFLDDNTTLLPYEYEDNNKIAEKDTSEPLNKSPAIDKKSQTNNDIKITIGEYDFISNGKEIKFPTIKIKNWDQFNKAYDKLKEFMNER